MKRHIFNLRKLALLSVTCSLLFLLTGCELVDLIKKVIRDVYGSPTQISILVYPPFPSKNNNETSGIKKSFSFAEGVKRGLSNGISEFNEASDRTRVIPIWYTNSDAVIDFYDDILAKLNSGRELRAICREKIESVRRNSEYKNVSCVIFGLFEFNPYATSLKVQLFYYDYSKDLIATQVGVVEKSDSRARESDLQNLMKTLLKKVYD